jgi:hypothetical protein
MISSYGLVQVKEFVFPEFSMPLIPIVNMCSYDYSCFLICWTFQKFALIEKLEKLPFGITNILTHRLTAYVLTLPSATREHHVKTMLYRTSGGPKNGSKGADFHYTKAAQFRWPYVISSAKNKPTKITHLFRRPTKADKIRTCFRRPSVGRRKQVHIFVG